MYGTAEKITGDQYVKTPLDRPALACEFTSISYASREIDRYVFPNAVLVAGGEVASLARQGAMGWNGEGLLLAPTAACSSSASKFEDLGDEVLR